MHDRENNLNKWIKKLSLYQCETVDFSIIWVPVTYT